MLHRDFPAHWMILLSIAVLTAVNITALSNSYDGAFLQKNFNSF